MNNIERLFKETSDDIQRYAQGYLEYLTGILSRIDTKKIALFVEELEDARRNHNTVFFIGNGGSAVTASHIANDFGVGSCTADGSNPYRTMALTDNVAQMTAIANDHGYNNLFVYQLQVHYRTGDKLVAISASGNSANIIAASEWVKKRGGTVIGLIGFDGGKLKDICDIAIHVPTLKGEYGPVEDAHVIIEHLIYMWLHYKEKNRKASEITV